MKLMGLRHDVVAKDDIYYLLFYDIDGHILNDALQIDIDAIMHTNHISYFLYKTKHGYHLIGLTPLTAMQWANVFTELKRMFPSYYGGIVVRIWRKPQEVQELLQHRLDYGEVIPNLYNIYADRFGLQKREWKKEFSKYLLVFEKYRTEKE